MKKIPVMLATLLLFSSLQADDAPLPANYVLTCANQLATNLGGHFKTRDLVYLIKQAEMMVDKEANPTLQEKRAVVTEITSAALEMLVPSSLTNALTYPVFKEAVPPFVTLLVTEVSTPSQETLLDGHPSPADSTNFANELVAEAKGDLHISALPQWINKIILQANRYHEASSQEKIASAKFIYHVFITSTNTVGWPDPVIDPFLRDLGDSFIESSFSP